MPWIESHTQTIRHRKVADLARELRLRRSHALGHLHSLWHAALEQQEDGDLSAWSDEFIAEAADVPRNAPQFVRLLQTTGFLDGKVIHDWLDYAGKYLISKYGGGSERGRERLIAIWTAHGRVYGGDKEVSGKGLKRDSTNQTNQPSLNKKSASEKLRDRLLNAPSTSG